MLLLIIVLEFQTNNNKDFKRDETSLLPGQVINRQISTNFVIILKPSRWRFWNLLHGNVPHRDSFCQHGSVHDDDDDEELFVHFLCLQLRPELWWRSSAVCTSSSTPSLSSTPSASRSKEAAGVSRSCFTERSTLLEDFNIAWIWGVRDAWGLLTFDGSSLCSHQDI